MSLTCFGKAELLGYAGTSPYPSFTIHLTFLDMVVRIINPLFFSTLLKKEYDTSLQNF